MGSEEEGLDEASGWNEDDIVVMVDEDDNEHRFVMLALVEVDDKDYAMLAPEGQLIDEEGEELEIFLFNYAEDEEGRAQLSEIEDPDTFQRVQEFCATLVSTGGIDLDPYATEPIEH